MMQKERGQRSLAEGGREMGQGKGTGVQLPEGPGIARRGALIHGGSLADRQAQLAAKVDASPGMAAQLRLADMIHGSPRMALQRRAAESIHGSPRVVAQLREKEATQNTGSGTAYGRVKHNLPMKSEPGDRPEPSSNAAGQVENQIVQRVIHKGKTMRADVYVRAPEVNGMTTDKVKELMKSDKHYAYDKKTKEVEEIVEKEPGGEKSEFVLKHEQKSRAVRDSGLEGDSKKRKRVEELFARAKAIQIKGRKTKGTTVHELDQQITKIYDEEIDRESKSEFQRPFQIGETHFKINIKNQSKVESVEDVLAVTHVSLKGTQGKSSYASMVENGIYPTLGDNESMQSLYALEALRNHEFIPSLMAKNSLMASGDIDMEAAIDPEVYGGHEVKGAAGKERRKFRNQRRNSTLRLLEAMPDDNPLKEMMEDKDPSKFEKECEDSCHIQ